MRYIVACAFLATSPACAELIEPHEVVALPSADVIFLGEVHDNPAHHEVQAKAISAIAPAALVFEMLTETQADAMPSELLPQAELNAALGWDGTGWPDFALYYPLFEAAPTAQVFGAGLPREAARAAMGQDADQVFTGDAARFGLTDPLPEDQQAAREDLQAKAHCDALPEELLPGMVAIQRLRDAMLADAALRAFEQTGGPVVVITGTGHARTDWGAPYLLAQAAPEVRSLSVGQFEITPEESPPFDYWIVTDPHPRPDPCEIFQ